MFEIVKFDGDVNYILGIEDSYEEAMDLCNIYRNVDHFNHYYVKAI